MLELSGKKFGKLTAIEKSTTRKHSKVVWRCLCDCSKEVFVIAGDLNRGHSRSCGCTRGRRTHNLRKHPLYTVWFLIKQRCFNQKATHFNRYGGRGIIMCEEWRHNFKKFYDWATANGWKKGLQIDRRNNDGNYYPSNCRFVTPRENCSNTSRTSKFGVGVRKKESGRFQSECQYAGRKYCLGTFDTPKKAQRAREKFLKEKNVGKS